MSVSDPSQAQGASSYQQAGAPVGYAGGAIGTPTSFGKVLVLSIVTFGIYGMIWIYRTFKELNAFRNDGPSGGMGLVLTLVTLGLYGDFVIPGNIEKAYGQIGRPSPVSTMTGFFIFIPYIGGIYWMYLCQKALNDLWVGLGAQPA